ncbi:hypothetical protein KDA00_01405 [Candidatus Saccharibacteria bacterium]|nr:hypothetical protein [Candidatus Saccharibacteria bacterium]
MEKVDHSGINTPPEINEEKEKTFRRKAIERLINEHQQLGIDRINKWLVELNDEDPRARVMAATAVWVMMDVQDNYKQLANRESIGDTSSNG